MDAATTYVFGDHEWISPTHQEHYNISWASCVYNHCLKHLGFKIKEGWFPARNYGQSIPQPYLHHELAFATMTRASRKGYAIYIDDPTKPRECRNHEIEWYQCYHDECIIHTQPKARVWRIEIQRSRPGLQRAQPLLQQGYSKAERKAAEQLRSMRNEKSYAKSVDDTSESGEDSDDRTNARIEVWKRTATKEQLERVNHRNIYHEIRTHVNENRPVKYSMEYLNNISRSIRFNTTKEAQDRIERWAHQATREQQEAIPYGEAFQKVRQQIIEGQPE